MDKIYLTPNPNKGGKIDRVAILKETRDGGHYLVLDVDAVTRNPEYLGRYVKGSGAATRFWDVVSSIVFVGCIVLSFLWHWWAFIPGLLLTTIMVKANRQSVAQFSVEAVNANPQALEDWSRVGLIWRADKAAVVPE